MVQQYRGGQISGTKVFTLTGDVVNKPLFELPTDVTIRDVVFGLAGGVKDGKRFKAVQIGGTSGGFIPESLLDTPVDFDSMAAIGATLGSGAVLVLDETRDIVDIVTRIAKFFEHESCGKCAPAEGTADARNCQPVNQGLANAEDIELLERLSRVMTRTCLCGLARRPAPC